MAKEITIIKTYGGHRAEFTGTVAHLVSDVFGYTLSSGNSYDKTIPRWPRTAKGLVRALNDASALFPTWSGGAFYELKAEEE